MGRGSYTASDWSKLKNSRNLGNVRNEQEIFKNRSCDPRFNPIFIQKREARDSEDHPESVPIIIGLDVTASMGFLAKKVAEESLNETMMKLYSTNAVKDPALMFAAYGDYGDNAPLQVTQFESDIRIAEQLLDLWLENGGHGKVVPQLLWYFAANHTLVDNYEKRKQKGFIFTIGDNAECRDDLSYDQTRALHGQVFGEDTPINVRDTVKAAGEKYEMFHIFINQGPLKPVNNISDILPGHTMKIKTGDIDMIPELIISTIQMAGGMSLVDTLKQWPEEKLPVLYKTLSELKFEKPKKGLFF